MINTLKKFLSGVKGSLATTVAIMAVPIFGAGGVAADYALIAQKHASLQAAADAAALAGAKELGVASTKDDTVFELAKHFVFASFSNGVVDNDLKVKTEILNNRSELKIDLDYYWEPFMIQFLNPQILPIKVTATASLAGSESLCVIALDPAQNQSLAMTGESSITANGCAIYSNSTDPKGISLVSGAILKANSTYSGGGYSGPVSGFMPEPVTDSPIINDPLEDRTTPIFSSCDNNNIKINNGSTTLYPGVYCGGLSIGGASNVFLKPGEYIIKDGPLKVSGNSTIKGENVGFYFEGAASTFDFGVSTQINLSAPVSGALSGLLFFESHSAPANRNFMIRSKDAERFEGTVYLPKGKLIVDKESRVGQLSDWTAIIANQIEIKNGPKLVINSNYVSSSIPVPKGIGPSGTEPRLTN